jgi:hypothetical protein
MQYGEVSDVSEHPPATILIAERHTLNMEALGHSEIFCLSIRLRRVKFFKGVIFFNPLSLFWKINTNMLMRSPCCLCVYCPPPPLHAWSSLYETRYVYHDTWAHLNCSLCVCMCIPPIVARQRLKKSSSSNTLAIFFYLPIYLQSVTIHSVTISRWCDE